jgi:hypothetical protein
VTPTGSWGTLIFGGMLTAAMIASYNMPGGPLPGRRERPRSYWTTLGIGVAAVLFGALDLLTFGTGL